jgi:hypothetical protein
MIQFARRRTQNRFKNIIQIMDKVLIMKTKYNVYFSGISKDINGYVDFLNKEAHFCAVKMVNIAKKKDSQQFYPCYS